MTYDQSALMLNVLALVLASTAVAQTPAPPPLVAIQDVSTPEAILQAMYNVISGPAGQARDWDRLRAIMTSNARFVTAGVAKDGAVTTRDISIDEYIAAHGSPSKVGFYERGVPLHVERYGHTAVVESPYEGRHAPGEAPFARGINQFVLIGDDKRWWVTEVIWDAETPGNPLPPDADAALNAR